MGFSMRINFVDVIVADSLRAVNVHGENVGFEFDIRLSDYRGMYLSCIKDFSLKINSKDYDPSVVRFCLNGKEFIASQLPGLTSEYWFMLDCATIKVIDLIGLDQVENEIDLTLNLRVPYLPIPGGKNEYITLNSSGVKRLEMKL